MNLKVLKWGIIFFIFLLLVNLIITSVSVESSFFYWLSNSSNLPPMVDSNSTIPISDPWAVRGQIGDIMSGHFSALAFLAVALSIVYQSEANGQMRKSIDKQEEAIEQQNIALQVQSKALEAQIKELEESREESSKQTEEFAINNMNIKLDRYYKLLNEKLIKLDGDQGKIYKNKKVVKQRLENGDTIIGVTLPNIKKDLEELENLFDSIYEVLEFIFLDIESMQNKLEAYNVFSGEFKIRIKSDYNLINMLIQYPANNEKYTVSAFLHELKIDTMMG